MTNARRLHSSNLGFIDNIVPGVPSHAVTVKKCFQLLCAESTKRTYFCLSSIHTFGKILSVIIMNSVVPVVLCHTTQTVGIGKRSALGGPSGPRENLEQ